MLAYVHRMNLLFPVAAASTAHSFLAAAVADDSTANAIIDARIKALEANVKTSEKGKRQRKVKSPGAAPAASTQAVVYDKNIQPCGLCKVWNRHDPTQFPDIFLWGKCKHNPLGVP